MKRKKLSEENQLAVAAYEAAAERIGSGDAFYGCDALWVAPESIRPATRSGFYDWFCPPIEEGRFGWWPDVTFHEPEGWFRENTMRILALLLMAELVRDGQIDFDAP